MEVFGNSATFPFMSKERIISREYKLVLNKDHFAGDQSGLIEKCKRFWSDLAAAIKPIEVSGMLDQMSVKRELRFYDTDNRTLYHHDYIFRERKEPANKKKEITLKFRHPDRYVSENRDMLPKKIGKGSRKLEEDIKIKFQTLFSYSSNQACKDEQQFRSLGDISKFYPGIKTDLAHFDDGEKVKQVNSLEILELVIKGGVIVLSESAEEKAESALIVWYDLNVSIDTPLIVEFSFRYGDKKGKYDRDVSQNAYNVFLNIQQKMDSWLDKNANTKTGFLYKE